MSKPPQKNEVVPKDRRHLLALADKAQRGDESALPAVRELLQDPVAVDLLGGDLARDAQRTLIAKFCGQNLLVKEAINRKLESLRSELAGPTPAPLERMLVERVVACWLHLHHLETVYAGKDSMTLQLGAYYQRCISAAQKRYLGAIKTLALVRKLALPVLQVNIAKRQVNVAGPCVVGDAPKGTP